MNKADLETLMLEIREEQIKKKAIEDERRRIQSERKEWLMIAFTAIMSIVSLVALVRTF